VDGPADPARGRAVFRRECASCHRLDREGFAVGPDLFGIRNQPKPTILLHILVPDLEITQGFSAYTVATKDGRVLTGLIASETPTSLTLRQPLGKEDTLLRDEIDELSAGTQSLMPPGVEKNITRRSSRTCCPTSRARARPRRRACHDEAPHRPGPSKSPRGPISAA
jgi:putative heme-binding domain-containing protein